MIRLDFNRMSLNELMLLSKVLNITYSIENGKIVKINKNPRCKSKGK